MSELVRIGYLTSAYGRPSDTFIRNEVNHLRDAGAFVQTYSIRRPDLPQSPDSEVRSHRLHTEYLLEAGAGRILFGACRTAVRHPLRMLKAARCAVRSQAPGVRGALRQCVYSVEAAYLADRLQHDRIEHLHNHIGENSATVAMLASVLANIPYSMTIHGPGIFYAPEHWALGEKIRNAAFTICISDFCLGQCTIFAPRSAWERLHVVRCSVQDRFLESPSRRFKQEDPPRFVFVGRMCVEKGQRILLEAADRLRKEGRQFRIAMIGDGPLRASLQASAARYELHETVEFLGWLPSERVKDEMLRARAVVLPSFAEGLPIVLMEALALECPVISTPVAGIPELVEHGRNGWLVPAGAIGPLADAMEQALDLPADRLDQMGRDGREKVLALHHPRQQVQQLLRLFLAATRLRDGNGAPAGRRERLAMDSASQVAVYPEASRDRRAENAALTCGSVNQPSGDVR